MLLQPKVDAFIFKGKGHEKAPTMGLRNIRYICWG